MRDSHTLAQPPTPLGVPPHADLRVLVECRGGLLLGTHAAAPETRSLPLNRQATGRYRLLCQGPQL